MKPLNSDEPKPWLVYGLECSDGTYYIGATNDLERRLSKHNAGKASAYTRSRMPVRVIWSEVVGSKSDALKREAGLKKLSRNEKTALFNGTTP